MKITYIPHLLKSFFTVPTAMVRNFSVCRWFIADIARTFFVYGTALRVPIVDLPDVYPEIHNRDATAIVIPASRPAQRSTAMVALASLVAYLRPRTVFEFGTNIGAGTLLLAENAKQATVYTLNLPNEDSRLWPGLKDNIGSSFRDTTCEKRITQLFGDSTKFDYSSFAGQIDFIFIDAAHDYDSVRSDTENALQMLSSRGVIIWHDFPSCLGVKRYLMEFAKQHKVLQIRDTRLALFSPGIERVNTHQHWAWE